MISGILAALGVIVCLGWFLWAWGRESRRALIFTPFLIFCLNEIFRNWFAGLYAPSIQRAADHYPLFVMLAGFIAFLFGFIVLTGSVGYHATDPEEYRDRPIGCGDPTSYLIAIAFVAVLLLGAALYLYQGVPPVLTAIRSWWEGSLEAEVARYVGARREEITKGHYFGGEYRGQGALRALGRIGWPLLTGTALLLYLRERTAWLAALTTVLLLLQFAVVAGDGTRGPFIWSLVYLVILLSLVVRLKYRHLILAGAGAVVALVGMSVLSPKMFNVVRREGAAAEVIRHIVERILLGNGINTVAIIELVREGFWSLRGGAVHLQRLGAALPGVQSTDPFTYELYLALNPGGTATTYLSATYLGDLYIDFGLVGTIAGYGILGMGVALAQMLILRAPKSVLTIPLYAHLILSVGRLSLGGPLALAVQALVIAVVWSALVGIYLVIRGAAAERPPEKEVLSPA